MDGLNEQQELRSQTGDLDAEAGASASRAGAPGSPRDLSGAHNWTPNIPKHNWTPKHKAWHTLPEKLARRVLQACWQEWETTVMKATCMGACGEVSQARTAARWKECRGR